MASRRSFRLLFVAVIVASSALICTPDEARAYYRARLVGDHEITSRGQPVCVRFNAEEIHLFTEDIRDGSTPRPEMLIMRAGGREGRVFSRQRARLLDRILPTIKDPAKCLRAKNGGFQLIGPAGAEGDRLAVVIGADRGVWYVRTAYPLDAAGYRHALTARPAPWPPK